MAGWAPGVLRIVASSWFQSTMLLPDPGLSATRVPLAVVVVGEAAAQVAVAPVTNAATPMNAASLLVVFFMCVVLLARSGMDHSGVGVTDVVQSPSRMHRDRRGGYRCAPSSDARSR